MRAFPVTRKVMVMKMGMWETVHQVARKPENNESVVSIILTPISLTSGALISVISPLPSL